MIIAINYYPYNFRKAHFVRKYRQYRFTRNLAHPTSILMIRCDLAYQAGIVEFARMRNKGRGSARRLPCSFTPIRITSRRFVSGRERATLWCARGKGAKAEGREKETFYPRVG